MVGYRSRPSRQVTPVSLVSLVALVSLLVVAGPGGLGGLGGLGGFGAPAGAASGGARSPVLAAACAGTLQASTTGTVASDALTEISGIAASRRNRGVYWVHNDSGDTARVFAIDATGRTRGEFALEGAQAVDWEDIAVAPGPGQSRTSRTWSIYVADIGDNTATRPSVTVYRVPEPAVPKDGAEDGAEGGTQGGAQSGDPAPRILPGAAALTFTYPDGAHDAEALLVDPRGHDLLVVTKDLLGGRGVVYRGRADAAAGTQAVLERVAGVSLGLGRGVTAGDVTADGGTVALRNYLGVVLYPRPDGKPLWQAFSQPSCAGSAPSITGIGGAGERQGEAIAFLPGGRAYVTVGEGAHPSLHRFAAPSRAAAR